jgi:filamentous hemagglutinin family protein
VATSSPYQASIVAFFLRSGFFSSDSVFQARALTGLPGNYSGYQDNFLGFAQRTASALFVNHVLYLMNTDKVLIAALHFANNYAASDFAIYADASGTKIREAQTGVSLGGPPPANVAVATTGAVPMVPAIVLPTPVATLSAGGPNLSYLIGNPVASYETLDHHSITLGGLTSASEPTLNETDTVFGSQFTLAVEGVGVAARFGALAAMGANQNAGLIETVAGTSGGPATLAITLSDIVSPLGTTLQAGSFTNTGTINAGTGTTIRITGSAASTLINTGSVLANGMVFLGTEVDGTGNITVGATGGVEAARYVVPTESVLLKAGTLTLDQAATFRASILDFNSHAQILVKGVSVGSETYLNGILLLDGGGHGALHLVAPSGATFNTSSFVLTHQGADTIITTHNTVV